MCVYVLFYWAIRLTFAWMSFGTIQFYLIETTETLKKIKNALASLPKDSEACSRTHEEAPERTEGRTADSE